MMASSPVSAAASQTGQTTVDEGAAVPVPADAQLGPDLQHIYQLLVRHAEMLAAIVQACRAEVLAAIADVRRLLRFLGLH